MWWDTTYGRGDPRAALERGQVRTLWQGKAGNLEGGKGRKGTLGLHSQLHKGASLRERLEQGLDGR